jgi:uncharacterized beta-barrel protein YwiB (DUF1934 family)
MKQLLSICLLALLVSNASYSQSLDIQNSRTVIQNIGNQIADLTISIDTSKVQELGFKNIDELNLLGNAKPTNIGGSSVFSPHVSGKFYTFQYDGIFLIQSKSNANPKTLNQNPTQNLELYYTIRAIEILKLRYTFLYQKLIASIVNPQVQSTGQENFTNWYNRYPKIVISFNTGSKDIAISGTYLDPASISFTSNGQTMNLYENFPIISINSEIIKGTNQTSGSFPIYKKSTPQENYLLYLKEGLLQSICHELIHRSIDINNIRKGSIFNYISFGNGRRSDAQYDKNLYNLEEVIVNRTLDKYFRQSGGLSNDLLNYYLKVENDLLNSIGNLESYKKSLLSNTSINQDLSLDL